MKKLLLTAGIASSVLFLGACSSNEALVTLGEDKITKEEFYQELKTAQGQSVLQKLIETKVLGSKYNVTDAEVEEEIARIKANFPTEDEFKAAISQYGLTTDALLKEYVKTTLLQFKAISEGVKVSDEDLKKFFEENKDSYVQIEASHILVDKKEDADTLLKQLEDGADFAKVAQENSKDGSAQNGGSLGVFGKGQMVEEFDKAAFSLKEGELSEVVKTQYGYHIIKLDKIHEKNLETSKDDIKKDYLMKNGKPYPEVMAKLLKDAKIEVKDEDYKDLVQQMIDQYQMSMDAQTLPAEVEPEENAGAEEQEQESAEEGTKEEAADSTN